VGRDSPASSQPKVGLRECSGVLGIGGVRFVEFVIEGRRRGRLLVGELGSSEKDPDTFAALRFCLA
jgi:hypothetical protein